MMQQIEPHPENNKKEPSAPQSGPALGSPDAHTIIDRFLRELEVAEAVHEDGYGRNVYRITLPYEEIASPIAVILNDLVYSFQLAPAWQEKIELAIDNLCPGEPRRVPGMYSIRRNFDVYVNAYSEDRVFLHTPISLSDTIEALRDGLKHPERGEQSRANALEKISDLSSLSLRVNALSELSSELRKELEIERAKGIDNNEAITNLIERINKLPIVGKNLTDALSRQEDLISCRIEWDILNQYAQSDHIQEWLLS